MYLYTERTEDDDRRYVTDYMDMFCECYGRWPEPFECPYRGMRVERDTNDGLLVKSITHGEWVLGTMPFRKPSTFGMIHCESPRSIDRMNRCVAPKTVDGIPWEQLTAEQVERWRAQRSAGLLVAG